jgi:3-mercaptopyruvate sulfurtransferase SseA
MLMRAFILVMAVGLPAVLVGCNSQEANPKIGDIAQKGQSAQNPQKTQTPQTVQPAPNSLDTARRITAQELHKLWQKDEVLIVDTRNEPSFKQGHIRGSILIPYNEFSSRADELPKSKMIVTYCT